MATVETVCTSETKGVIKEPRPLIVLRQDYGIEGDGHAGPWHRQVSLLAGESIDQVKLIIPDLKSGAFAENIITRGIDLTKLLVGTQLKIGPGVLLEVTQIGKKCHNDGCAIKQATGDCIMPREGIFARVLTGGQIVPGDGITVQGRMKIEDRQPEAA